MATLPAFLVHGLRSHNVHIDAPDADTLVLRRVPLRADSFNKPVTNLLVKRPAPGMPFLALVDENLSYVGADPSIKTAFAGIAAQRGWRPLALDNPADRDLELVLQDALRLLGFVTSPAPSEDSVNEPAQQLLTRFGKPIKIDKGVPLTIGRDDAITDVTACLHRREPCMPLIVGAPGSGKTNVLRGVARRLDDLSGDGRLIELSLVELFAATNDAGRMRCVTELLGEVAEAGCIAAIEHVELLTRCVAWGQLVLGRALDAGTRIIGTVRLEALDAFDCPTLARRVQVIELAELPREHLMQILLAASARYSVDIHESAILACARAARDLPGHFPGKALALLDATAALALVSNAKVVTADDIYCAAQKFRPRSALHHPDDQAEGDSQ